MLCASLIVTLEIRFECLVDVPGVNSSSMLSSFTMLICGQLPSMRNCDSSLLGLDDDGVKSDSLILLISCLMPSTVSQPVRVMAIAAMLKNFTKGFICGVLMVINPDCWII